MSCLNALLPQMKGIHGEASSPMATLIGNGPSLVQTDVGAVKGVVVGVNRAWKIGLKPFNRKFAPLYYVICDEQHIQELRSGLWRCTALIFLTTNADPPDDVSWIRLTPLPWPKDNVPGWSDDMVQGVNTGSVMHMGLQILAWLGFKEINLLGVDQRLGEGRRAHFYDDVGPTGAIDVQHQESLFRIARKNLDRLGVKIRNLSPGTMLDAIEKEEFGKVFFP